MRRSLALIAHDGKKEDMAAFAVENRGFLSAFPLIATASTGRLLRERVGLDVECLRHGPEGGDVQIASRVIDGQVAAVFFFVEELDVHPHDPDIKTLMRACNIVNIPLATNPATARLILSGDLRPDPEP
ncbi:MAG: methylglyoxal synthase [Fimbriimonadales bacterium]|nr:methylglyoxal synthase [Fimbriimonadales bacterium]